MKTITVSKGDIVLSNGKIQFSTGNNKLVEDLTRWLQEPLGTGFTTPAFGSILHTLVGSAQDNNSVGRTQSEILRVLQLYQGQQVLALQSAQNSAQLANWSRNEIIQEVTSVNVQIYNDTIYALVQLKTLNGNVVDFNLSINPNGVALNNG